MKTKTYLIIGNGVAGTTAAETIRKQDPTGSITILSEEDIPFYYRIRLNDFIAGEVSEDKLIAKKKAWYQEQRLELRLNTRIAGLDAAAQRLTSDRGEKLSFDRLLLATGSHSFLPPIKGIGQQGVFALRHIKDARAILAQAGKSEEVILIGGGLLGLEAGNALRRLGKKVTVVEFFPRLLPRQLDSKGAKRLQKLMEKMGFAFRLSAMTKTITHSSTGKVDGIVLEGGDTLPGQMVIVSAGVRPNLELAQSGGLDCDKGVTVNDRLETSANGIYAAGDVAEHQGVVSGIWPAAMQQGKVAGANMAGGEALYQGATMSNILKVAGIDVAAAGNIDAEGRYEAQVVSSGSIYKKLVIENNRIIGCVMVGDTANFSTITRYITEQRDITTLKNSLL
ncbi:MAG: NAD(P)/FAD-dependent oxidoreductase [Deltaproteobacteria bacterium]|uniref:NAD(P)/FAD-dependent oxidoreductase n=1 Tax=Hydrosulfovibrio ferrireducens TaxID=2934181 RepID=UPI001205CEBF|nr:MAG: NAD(P)/FAD-dependent oxidoreductase [Deltaproteobacteria bacterium]